MATVLIVGNDDGSYEIEKETFKKLGVDYNISPYTNEEIVLKAYNSTIIMFSATKFDEKLLSSLPNLKLLCRYGIGIDNVDLNAATKLGIYVCNCPGYGAYDVAEHAVALILSSNHSVARFDRNVRNGNWSLNGIPPAKRIKSLTLGFIGFGRIARWICKMMVPFEMRILVFDPFVSDKVIQESGGLPSSFVQVISDSDYLSVNAPLTSQTKHIINKDALQKMKSSCVIINTGRGALINEEDLIEALEKGLIAGAALDVFENEPLTKDSKLLAMENVTLTPHVAWYSQEAIRDLHREAVFNVTQFLEGGPVQNALNTDR